jgi:hypothetical protein
MSITNLNLDIAAEGRINFRAGNSIVKDINVTDENGVPYGFSGYSGDLQIRDTSNGNDILIGTIDVTLSTGLIHLEKSATDTINFKPGTFVWALNMTDSNGVVTTWLYGKIVILEATVKPEGASSV